MGRVVAVCNQKGGVAKTTSAFHLGVAWAALGRRVLWVDMDPQAALTDWAGHRPAGPGDPTVYHGLMGRVPASQLIRPSLHGPDLLPSGIELSMAEMELVAQMGPERRLARLLVPLRDGYDYVVVDCQPSLGLLTQNALVVADEVLVPVACEYLALRVLDLVLQALRRIRVQSNSVLGVLGILPTLYDGRTLHARRVVESLRAAYGQRYWVVQWPVVKSVRFAEAAERRVPIWEVSPEHPGAQAYRLLAQAVDGGREAVSVRELEHWEGA